MTKGDRLVPPEHADDFTASKMRECWEFLPKDRPKFSELRKNFYDELRRCAPEKLRVYEEFCNSTSKESSGYHSDDQLMSNE